MRVIDYFNTIGGAIIIVLGIIIGIGTYFLFKSATEYAGLLSAGATILFTVTAFYFYIKLSGGRYKGYRW